ncbi:MAG: selenocysteine-specific translation elongation factor [Pseudonocardiales bacterium]|nr:selenocysteine-specific translation elongation factor [Pseudonocardiales bacterium]MBV9031908.1 selenocysteine-specific translation elongation factor [Pseudonocardiales bacterium]MBW0010641.1 selenocysteine-specific translation elongation factor [Pseudonocardiales bacterium]
MHVVATAGHVDHGKSTLVRALTGMEPDRWAAERRRGMTIDLGFAWTTLPTGPTVAFVDVPGHERFVPNMLAGVGPVPAVLFVVAADEGWMPQSREHLEALHALNVRHGLLAVTRSDLMDPEAARGEALEHLAGSSLGRVPSVCVSGLTGAGLDDLRAALGTLAARLPAPDLHADVRLWVDRAFTIHGAGTVVTGTLAGGTLRVGDELELGPGGRRVGVRGLQSLGVPVESAPAVARVAVNLRGVPREAVRRGDAVLTPGAWLATRTVDVRLSTGPAAELPRHVVLHAGTAAVAVRVRPLGVDTARLGLAQPLPLRIGDRALLRDPGSRRVTAGVTVLDVVPPVLRRRGAAAARAAELGTMDGTPDGAAELRRRGVVRRDELVAMGASEPAGVPQAGGWLVDPAAAAQRAARLADAVAAHAVANPLRPGMPLQTARHVTGMPDARLVELLLGSRLAVTEGRVHRVGPAGGLPDAVRDAIADLRAELARRPFAAPEAHRLAELGLGAEELAAAVRAGELLKIADGIYLAPGAEGAALERLRGLPSPFTLSQARQALDTTRRVAVPIMELLARRGITRRLPDHTHELRS